MKVYVLQFADHDSLNRAFALLMGSERIGSCSAEAESGRLRFVSPPEPAEKLVHRIYLEGGLTWCSRHECSGLPASDQHLSEAELRPS